MENLGIDPNASRMRNERSTIWARTPYDVDLKISAFPSKIIFWISFGNRERRVREGRDSFYDFSLCCMDVESVALIWEN